MSRVKKGDFLPSDYCRIPDIEARLMRAAREAKYPIDEDGRLVKPSKASLDLIAKVQKEAFADNHLCVNCITPTQPGDKFCSVCGHQVAVWGVCSQCKKVLPANANFCPSCGKRQ